MTSIPLPSRRPAATTPAIATPADPFTGIPPLREDLQLPKGEFTVAPDSSPDMVVGVAAPFTLGHCGLYSPVDLDGSLWMPVGGKDPKGGPIDADTEIGRLINSTPGDVVLVSHERLDWRSRRNPRVVVSFRRMDGTWDYPRCM